YRSTVLNKFSYSVMEVNYYGFHINYRIIHPADYRWCRRICNRILLIKNESLSPSWGRDFFINEHSELAELLFSSLFLYQSHMLLRLIPGYLPPLVYQRSLHTVRVPLNDCQQKNGRMSYYFYILADYCL